MSDEGNKIILKKNQDGSTTKVVVKKVTLKVKVKAPEKPEDKAPAKPEAGKPEVKPDPAKPADTRPPQRQPLAPQSPYPPRQPYGAPRPYSPRPGFSGAPRPGFPGQGPPPPKKSGRTIGPGPGQGQGQSKDRPPFDPRKKKIFVARKKPGEIARPGAPADDRSRNLVDKKKHGANRDRYSGQKDSREQFGKLSGQLVRRNDDGSEDEFANVPKRVEIPEVISLKNLAMKLNLKVAQVIKKFLSLGVMDLTVNDAIDAESATILCAELKCEVKVVSLLEQTKVEEEKGNPEDYVRRDPIVTVMGHVDHGKTSLLDAIRQSDVAAHESGGITQHIGAYKVKIPKGEVLFIDTPGHAAFSAMRSRGAQVTDIVILVVSAVDGVMPQTIEAIHHAKTAGVPIVVAVNKMDVPGADPQKIKNQLSENGLVSEEWGGDTIFVEVSATKKTGITKLLESVLAQAEVLDFKANPKVRAFGYLIESKIEQGKGNVATVIVKNGTLRPGAAYLCGSFTGKVRALFNERGEEVKEAPPSTPVEIIGLTGFPAAGEAFVEMPDEREAKKVAERRVELAKENAAQNVKKITLTNLFDTMKAQAVKEYKVILKGDVFGSVEAIKELLQKHQNEEVKVKVIHSATGAINEYDVSLASTSAASIIGFKVRPNAKAKKQAEMEKVDIKTYQVIYDIVDDITNALQGMLKAEQKEEKLGALKVKEVFKISGVGKIAGCLVTEGKVVAKARIRLFRDDVQVYDGDISALKHYKNEAKEVLSGSECGLQMKDFQDIKVGDTM
ncbi:MAG: translation initiation factor IF-2, partial [Spirochaetia bacterium]|nr:translation initiation factor IF-2 [Spirochaetia bacterium]